MNFISHVLYLLPLLYMYDSLASYFAHLLAGRKLHRKIFVLQLPVALIQSTAYTAIQYIEGFSNALIERIYVAFFFVSSVVIIVSWTYFLFRDMDKKKRFFYVSTIYAFLSIADFGSNVLYNVIAPEFVGRLLSEYGNVIDEAIQHYPIAFIVYGCFAIIVWLVSKTNIWSKLQAFAEYPKLYIPMGMFYFLFYILIAIFGSILRFPTFWMVLIITLAYPALLIVVVLMVSDIKRTERLTAAQNLLLQQQSYISRLESIQREIRTIQHDYKNMLAGLYAQASEGNAEAVKEYIGTKLLKVDEAVREDLRQMNQLTLIEIPELKGLIMTKMLEAERDQIPFRLEVMFSVSRVSMATVDLLRCVGILLDNAIEEAREQKGAVVTLLLLQEDGSLSIVVKNPVRDKPDLSRIRNEGYSTKGPGRGVGLSNYQNIIQKYRNVTHETKIEDNHFVQALVLAEIH